MQSIIIFLVIFIDDLQPSNLVGKMILIKFAWIVDLGHLYWLISIIIVLSQLLNAIAFNNHGCSYFSDRLILPQGPKLFAMSLIVDYDAALESACGDVSFLVS